MEKEDVVLFGAGTYGRAMLPYVLERYNLLYWIDNDEKKWGEQIENITIASPDVLQNYQGKIIVAGGENAYCSIESELIKKGVASLRLYRTEKAINCQQNELIPHSIQELDSVNHNFQYYDLKNNMNYTDDKLQVMVFCTFFSTYVIQLINNISKRNNEIEISIITNADQYFDSIGQSVAHLFVFHNYPELKNLLEIIPVYDVFHLLWMERAWVYFREEIRNKCRILNVNIGGSDFYRSSKEALQNRKKLIDLADRITANTETTIDNLKKIFPDIKEKTDAVNYGDDVLDYIDRILPDQKDGIRMKYGIPHDKIVITCGHNASSAHQHIKMIQSLSKLPDIYKSQAVFVFPMTYPQGSDEYIKVIRLEAEARGLNYRILREFMNPQEMAEYAVISDVMIHVQTTDQLSSTMLEEMYAGAIVIAGDWLPYEELRKRGIQFWTVNEVEELDEKMMIVCDNFHEFREMCQKNKKLIHQLSSWDYASTRWISLWSKGD